ncbi:MAG: hypothetical protein DWQ34_18205 [Planctomycetota bacterium]|nr:MAG: hypothetical protein DWQ29_09880 [Planctomycetota bacterium]REJ90116.1 MAG: hypothetical protein DWQ34_18205 [Planctomycetota bacterium]REK21042.1 MAG: hypothetical protein DWQ41_22855 [Planctomycetota bacterium]REK38859.1 MAG: hypothetical protein DWQ45_03150 [Planctomycetota bacterium]
MSGWLAKATGALRREEPEEPQPFNVTCACGLQHSGLRRRRAQRIVCRSCGTSLFVLPRDPYPVPLAPPPRKKRKSKSKTKQRRPARSPSADKPQSNREKSTKPAASVAAASAKVGEGAARIGAGLTSGATKAGKGFVSFWKPFRLVVLGIVIAVLGTVWWSTSMDRSAEAVRDLKVANEAGREALAGGDLPLAHSEFTRAVAALDLLKRTTDPLAREIRQLQRETAAMTGIVPISPLEIVAETDRAYDDKTADAETNALDARYRGRWMVLDGGIRRGAGSQAGRFVFDIPFLVGDSNRRTSVEVSLDVLHKLKIGDGPKSVILAGRIEACELSSDRRKWTLRLDSESAFLWSSPENYLALGFSFDDEETEQQVRDVLTRQTRLMGLEP